MSTFTACPPQETVAYMNYNGFGYAAIYELFQELYNQLIEFFSRSYVVMISKNRISAVNIVEFGTDMLVVNYVALSDF